MLKLQGKLRKKRMKKLSMTKGDFRLIITRLHFILRSIVVLLTERVWRVVDEITGLTLMEIAEFGQIISKKMGMKEPPIVGMMKPGAGLGAMGAMKGPSAAMEEAKLEKTASKLKLESFDAPAKIKIIKEVRSFTDLGLKEAKAEKIPAGREKLKLKLDFSL